ncbi:MAG: mechanosensitive ion channel [Thermoflexaceae bacterium]|nr:mechanosensitive ion channel [Thermoflexaceae bacterium]
MYPLLSMTLNEAETYTGIIINRLLSASLEIVKKLIIVLLIWVIGKKLIKILLNIISKTFARTGMDLSLSKFLMSLIKFSLYAVLAVMIIGALGIETTSLITLIGSLGLTVGLSLQGSLSNFAGGVLILLFKPFKVGDYIVACGCEGTVQVIDLLYTKLYTVDNKMVTIPNGTLANSNITNVAAQPERRVDVSIDVSYDTDLKKAKTILENTIRANEMVLKDHDITIFVDVLGASGITLTTRCWVKSENYWTVLWDLREKFKEAMDENKISIPFPQMDVHMK